MAAGIRQRLAWVRGETAILMWKTPATGRADTLLRDAANEHMAVLEKTPEWAMSFYKDPRVQYAAG